MKRPHLTALLCFILAGLMYWALASCEYAFSFVLLGGFFELMAWKAPFKRGDK